ncbi:MAG: restriction endonuclease subunit S [Gammaproteobacteria bacterium]
MAASQKYGVIPQSLMMELNDSKVMLALKGTESFRHVEKDHFVISLRSFEGGIEHSNYIGCVSPAYTVLAPLRTVSPQYFKYLFKCSAFVSALQASTDSLRDGKSITYEQFGSISLCEPPIGEANSIARFLDHETAKIDTLIEKQQQLIKLLKEKRQAVISHAVTKGLNPNVPMKDSGVEWLGEVPAHWTIGKIKNLTITISKGTTPSTIGSDFESEGIRFLKAENIGKGFNVSEEPSFYISTETDELLARSRLKEGDVLVIIAGATTGQSSVLQKEILPANTNQAVSFIRPSESAYSEYISHWISTKFAQAIIWQGAVQAAQPNLSMETLGNIPIYIPPASEASSINEKIRDLTKKLDRLVNQAENAIQLLQERRTTLISAAVTGKIDVRDWQPPASAEAPALEATS